MSTPQVTIPDSAIERAARIASAMTADRAAAGHGGPAWSAQDVIVAAIDRGLAELELSYLKEG